MLVESTEPVQHQWNSKTKEVKENRRTPQGREQARWNKENKLPWRSHNRNWLLRALWLGVDGNSCQTTADRSRRLVEMGI